MKFNRQAIQTKSTSSKPVIADGRHIGFVKQLAYVGYQPAFNPEDEPVSSMGVVIHIPNAGDISKVFKVSESTASLYWALMSSVRLTEDENGDSDVQEALGQAVAVEIVNKGEWPNISGISPVLEFEEVPATPADMVTTWFNIQDTPKGDVSKEEKMAFNVKFQALHPAIRKAVTTAKALEG